MRKALVVGINNYPSAPLKGCVNDATDFANLLERNGDHSLNFNVLLKTNVLRKNELMELIADLFSGRNETALLYFSGHGFINELGGYLVTPDHRKYDEGISMKDILTLANQSVARNKVIILDCCHGGAMAAPALAHSELGHINEGTTILTASRHDEAAVEIRGRGVFTNLLLEAMRGGAANINGNITPGSIYAYIDQALGAWEQRPVFKTNVCEFISLRSVAPRITADVMKKITEYFSEPATLYHLDPSYEYTNDPTAQHSYIEPFARPEHTTIFKVLQKLQGSGLVEPVEEDHMYWAAMKGKACRLTPLGIHYWRLVKEKKI